MFLAAADFNGDGRLDVVTVADFSDEGPIASVVLGRGDGTFVAPAYFGLGLEAAYGIDTADFDGDGRPDLEAGGTAYGGVGLTTIQINRGDWPSVVPASPSLRIDDVTVTEGNAGSRAATFTVTRLPPAASQSPSPTRPL